MTTGPKKRGLTAVDVTVNTVQERSRLFKLPTEIRLMIFTFLLGDRTCYLEKIPTCEYSVDCNGLVKKTIHSNSGWRSLPPQSNIDHRPDATILRSCKQAFIEASQVLYDSNKFIVDIRRSSGRWNYLESIAHHPTPVSWPTERMRDLTLVVHPGYLNLNKEWVYDRTAAKSFAAHHCAVLEPNLRQPSFKVDILVYHQWRAMHSDLWEHDEAYHEESEAYTFEYLCEQLGKLQEGAGVRVIDARVGIWHLEWHTTHSQRRILSNGLKEVQRLHGIPVFRINERS